MAMLKRRKILLVEDHPLLRWVLETTLKEEGHDVAVEKSSEAAIAHGTGEAFDLIITDLSLVPGVDGLEVFRRIKTVYPTTRFILISAGADEDELEQARRLGFDCILEKPFPVEEIKAAIDALSEPAALAPH